MHLARGEPALALEALQQAQPYELGSIAVLAPVFLRGLALLQHGAAAAAREQFQQVLDHRGVDPFSPLEALAGLQLARARAQTGDAAGGRAATTPSSQAGRKRMPSFRARPGARRAVAMRRGRRGGRFAASARLGPCAPEQLAGVARAVPSLPTTTEAAAFASTALP